MAFNLGYYYIAPSTKERGCYTQTPPNRFRSHGEAADAAAELEVLFGGSWVVRWCRGWL